MKKITSLVLAVIMIIGVFAVMSVTASATTTVSGITIAGLYEPAHGKTPDDNVVILSQNCSVDSIHWYSYADKKWMTEGETFYNGNQYEVNIHVVADDGCKFYSPYSNMIATINSKTATVSNVTGEDNEKYLDISYKFTAAAEPTVLSTAAITGLTVPVAGEKAKMTYDSDGYNGYTVSGFEWRASNGDTVNDKYIYKGNTTYQARFNISAKKGYEFSNKISVTIGGKAASISTVTDYHKYEYMCVYVNYKTGAMPTEITDVALTVTPPYEGETPDLNATVSAEGVTVDQVWWKKITSTGPVSISEFVGGNVYMVTVKISADEGYYFRTDDNGIAVCNSTINGNTADNKKIYDVYAATEGKSVFVQYTFPETKYIAGSVNLPDYVNSCRPQTGEKPDYSMTTDNSNEQLSITKVEWYKKNDNGDKVLISADDTFEAGGEYFMVLYLKLDSERYTFGKDVKVYFGSDKDNWYKGELIVKDEVKCDVAFDPVSDVPTQNTEISEIRVKDFVAPVAGEHPVSSLTPAGNYKVTKIHWFLDDAEKDYPAVTANDVFEEGKTYYIRVTVQADDGYAFADNVVSYFNDETNEHTAFTTGKDAALIREMRVGFTAAAASETPTEPTTPTEPEHVHEWGKWTVTQKATSFEDGVETRECLENPAHTETRPIAMVSEASIAKLKYNYTGKVIKPAVTVKDANGNKLVSGVDYKVIYPKNPINAGLYMIDVQLIGKYEGVESVEYSIAAVKNPMTVKVSTKSVKLSAVKKKAQTVKGAITVSKAQGAVSYKITSVPKALGKLVKISSKGVITISKWAKAKKGTYKIKVKITAKGNKNYNNRTITKTLKIVIK